MIQITKFRTLADLLDAFKDEQTCINYLVEMRWQGNPKCPYAECGHDKVYPFKSGKQFKCAKCRKIFSVRVGTIFEESKIPLRKWFLAIYLITSHKKGISSLQLAKDVGVGQKCAWFMLHRIRHCFKLNVREEKLDGVIEADETFMGGAEGNKHKNKRTENTQGRSVQTKSAVVGVIKRGGELRVSKVADTSGYNLRPFVVRNVAFGANLMTDEWLGYKGLAQLFHHHIVKHNEGEYVKDDAHTNTLEGFWSLLKRGVDGIYHSISKKHLQQYLDEYSFRYNTRYQSESGRFDMLLNKLANHLTYKQLTLKTSTPNQQTLGL